MMSDETTRLRALLERAELPACGYCVMNLDTGHMGVWAHTVKGYVHVATVVDHGEVGIGARAQLFAAIPTALPGLLDAAERAERAERERDDLAATLETRNAEHALAMARVAELEAARLKGVAEGAALMHTVISGAVLCLATDDGLAMVLSALDAHREGRAVTLRMDLAADGAEVSRG